VTAFCMILWVISWDITVCHPSVALRILENLYNSAAMTYAFQHWNLHHS